MAPIWIARTQWGTMCHVLTLALSPSSGLLIPCPNRPGSFHITCRFAKRKINIPTILQPHRGGGYGWATSWQNQENGICTSKDSDQPGHPPSLIWVFSVRMKKTWSLATHWAHSDDSDQTGHMPRLIWVFTGHTFILLVFSWGSSNDWRIF